MKHIRRIIAFSLCVISLLSLSGCAGVINDAESLMHPPRSQGELALIESVIDNYSNGEYTFRYPQNGEYQNAIIVKDIDKDNEDEAIAFFTPEGDESGTIYVLFMNKSGEKWQGVGLFSGNAPQIDKVIFEDMNGDGICEILVGFGSVSSSYKTLSAYSFSENQASELVTSETYNELLQCDLNLDRKNEIVLLKLSSIDNLASANLLSLGESGKTLFAVSQVEMNENVTKLVNICHGNTGDGKPAVFIDGLLVNNSLITQVLMFENDKLSVYSDAQSIDTDTSAEGYVRNVLTLSSDIDGDLIIEVPKILRNSSVSLYDNERKCDRYSWCVLNENNLFEEKFRTVKGVNSNYYFVIPDDWYKKYTVVYNSLEKCIVFYKLDDEGRRLNSILKIKDVKSDELEQTNLGEYRIIHKDENGAVLVSVTCLQKDEMYLSDKQIKDSLIIFG